MSDPIIVVSAAIVDRAEKRLFMQRRDGKTSYPWHWVTPGGKRDESDGSDWAALDRELGEEHGVRLCSDCAHHFGKVVYEHELESTRTGLPTVVRCYLVDSTEVVGEYAAGSSVAGFDWVNVHELETLMLGPADHANRGKLMDLIR